MRVVNSDGSYVTTPVFDYQAYGELAQIRDDDLNPVTAKFTGKDFDTTLNLAYFGARWYDSELGIWMSPDPARQFFNPYSYGGNPVRYVDPNGEFLLEAIIISALISGYFSGAAANDSYNPMDWDINQTGDDIMAGMIIGGVSAGLGAGVAAPVAAGGLGLGYVAGGAVSALVNYNMTSVIQAGFSDWSASGALDATLKGAVVGAVSGGVGSYAGNATWNVAGTHGAALLSGAAGGATGAVLNQENILKGAMLGAAAGLAGSVASDVYSRNFGPSPYDSEGINAEGEGGISRAGLPDGTAVVFAGEGGSKWIEYLTGERYSHAGVIEGGNLHQAQILSGKDGANLRTELTKFDSRAYTVVGRGTPNPGAITTGRYNLLWRNCATQAARWSGTISANNPGTYLRVNTGSSYAHPYWNQASWGY
jgi:RHS repeat-associated protein